MVASSESQALEEYAKAAFVLELFETPTGEALKKKLVQGKQEHGLSRECLADYMAVHTHMHKAEEVHSETAATPGASGQQFLTVPRKMIGLIQQ